MFHHVLPDVPDAEVRALEPWHADTLFALVQANRAYLREWLPAMDELRAVTDARAFIAVARLQADTQMGLVVGVWYRDALAGMVGFYAVDPIDQVAEIGYWLGAVFQGRGIMTNAVRVLVRHAFETLHLRRLVILCAVGNARSAAVARRVGFTFAGVAREAEWLGEHCVDDEVFTLDIAAWYAMTMAASVAARRA